MASGTASGTLIADRYRVLERLGSGGMATVYLAEDERLGRRVAVKRLHAGSPEDTAQRFSREARLGASLNHRNLVTVFDTVADEDSVVIVMELVDGESLADALRRGPLPSPDVVRVVRGVASALDHAHEAGIVHRDIKPANILLGKGGEVKLADLGIATAVEGTRITHSGSVMGTAAYMAPEQLDGGDPEPRTDIYALAAVTYEMLAGRPAYRGGTPVEVAHAVVSGPLPDLAEAWPDAPPGAADAIRRGMAFRVADRPATACEFIDELADALESPPPTSATAPLPPTHHERPSTEPRPASAPAAATRSPGPRVQTAAAAAPPAQQSPGRTDHRRGRGPLVPLLALLALALIGGALALTLLGGDDDGGSSSSSETSAAEREARAERREARRQREAEQPPTPAPAPAPEEPAPAEPEAGGGSDYEVPQPSGSNESEGTQLQLQGHKMIESDPEGAVPVLERSVEAFPDGSDAIELQYAYFSLGKALRLAGRPDDAIPVLELRLKHPNQRSTVQAELDKARAAAG